MTRSESLRLEFNTGEDGEDGEDGETANGEEMDDGSDDEGELSDRSLCCVIGPPPL
ncbi:hypothetical protein D3C80_1995660 [compost metagenome]